jgi:hypothetical protein
MSKLNRKDIILLLLYAPGLSGEMGEAIKGRTRFTKLLFLLKELYNVDKEVKNYYTFEPYKIGPFTEELYNDLDVLETMGLVEIRAKDFVEESEMLEIQKIPREDNPLTYADTEAIPADLYQEFDYKLSDKGRRITEVLYDSVSSSLKQAVEDVKRRFGSLLLVELLRYIYRNFPKMATKSIREDLKGK